MKKKISSIFLAMGLCLVFLVLGSCIVANAEPTNSNQKTFSINSELVFRGDFSSHDIYFNVSKWWDVENAEVQVNYTRSQVASQDAKTYLVLSVNNIPFKSQEIYYKPNDEIQTLKVNVPKRLLKQGSNTLTVEAYMRISDLPCVDDVNPANWATLTKGTGIKLNFNNIEANNKVANFPYPYLKENDSTFVDTQVVVPNKYNDNDVANAFMLNTYLGRLFTTGTYNGTIVKAENINKSNNIIYVGSYDNLPQELKTAVGSVGNVDFSKEALIKQVTSPYTKDANVKALMILSNNPEMMDKAIKFMMNPSLVMQINSDSYVVNNKTEVLQEAVPVKNKITVQDLGADGIYLQGPFTRSTTLGYKMPKNRVLASGGKIHLDMRYSQNLDFNKALVTVYINNVPVGSKKLTAANADGDTLDLTIPRDIKDSAYLNIEISFDLAMDNTWCEKRQVKTPWAYVTSNSYFYLPAVQSKDFNFAKYPNPYIDDYELNNILVVAPDNMSSTDLTKLGGMFALMGENTKYNNGIIQVVNGSNVGSLKDDNNLIVYGTPNNNPFIKEINNDLWFKYNSDFNGFESNAKQYLTTPFNEQITTLQICKSPFNSQRGMMVVTAPNETNLQNSMLYLDNSKKILELTGDSAIVDTNGNLQNFQMVKPVDGKPSFDGLKQSNPLTLGLIGIFVLMVIVIIVAGLLYINKYKKEKNDKNSNNEFRKRLRRRK